MNTDLAPDEWLFLTFALSRYSSVRRLGPLHAALVISPFQAVLYQGALGSYEIARHLWLLLGCRAGAARWASSQRS